MGVPAIGADVRALGGIPRGINLAAFVRPRRFGAVMEVNLMAERLWWHLFRLSCRIYQVSLERDWPPRWRRRVSKVRAALAKRWLAI